MNSKKIVHYFYEIFVDSGMSIRTAKYLNLLILAGSLLLFVWLIDKICGKILVGVFTNVSKRTRTRFDNYLVKNRTPRLAAHLISLLIAVVLLPFVFWDFPQINRLVVKGADIFAILIVILIVQSLLRTFSDFLQTLPAFRDKPINSYVQVFMIFAWLVGILYVFVLLTEKSPLALLSTLGAFTAVILLIFKDSILGFVASIQVTVNDMVRIGDWITMEKYNADGDVIEINLATVKVQNFDKTITTIPTYYLISDSFKNWRGMANSDGRRIKRALLIKASSIEYLLDKRIQELKKIDLISEYLEIKSKEISDYNQEHQIDKSAQINGRNLTNLGVFRMYIEAYLCQNENINEEMIVMSRQLAPTPQGIPLEVYAFSKNKNWIDYERIVSDIFDHLTAAVRYFDLELFELPTSLTTQDQARLSPENNPETNARNERK